MKLLKQKKNSVHMNPSDFVGYKLHVVFRQEEKVTP